MQKIFRINLLARNQALRATRRKTLEKAKQEWAEHDQRQIAREKALRGLVKDERRHRREDWIAGPLAPKRDVGQKEKLYGTVDGVLVQGPNFPERARLAPKGNGWDPVGSEGLESEQKEWEGEGNEGNIVVGDRVCVIHGHENIVGRIGTVTDISGERKELTVDGINMADVELPVGTSQRERVAFQSTELPIPLAAVRLVYRLRDEETGRDRDVIVKHLRGGAPYFQRAPFSSLPRHTRYIAGEDVTVPWPEEEVPTYQAFSGDTSRFDVEYQSFTPSLYDPPLPSSDILDELRDDRYARDRRWHDDEYVREKILEDARSAWYEQRKLLTPTQELIEQKKGLSETAAEDAKSRGLTDETLQIILQTQNSKASGSKRKVLAR